jgi:hypothetical protein
MKKLNLIFAVLILTVYFKANCQIVQKCDGHVKIDNILEIQTYNYGIGGFIHRSLNGYFMRLPIITLIHIEVEIIKDFI